MAWNRATWSGAGARVGESWWNFYRIIVPKSLLPPVARRENPQDEGFSLVRVKGIEPSPQAWEARILPLNYTRPEHEGGFSVGTSPLKAEKVVISAVF